MSTPKVYLASLKHYNAGELVGRWFSVSPTLVVEAQDYMKSLNCEEWAIHDYEGFSGHSVSEYADLGELIEIGQAIEEHGELITHVMGHYGASLDEALNIIENQYQGAFDSVSDFIYDYVNDIGMLASASEIVKQYFDYESYARDLELNGELVGIEIDNETHVFIA